MRHIGERELTGILPLVSPTHNSLHVYSADQDLKRQHLSKWSSAPNTLLLIQKPEDQRTSAAMGLLLRSVPLSVHEASR